MGFYPFKSASELSAFTKVYKTVKDRLKTTVWVFECGDLYILSGVDVQHAEQSLPSNNVRKYTQPSHENPEEHIDLATVLINKNGNRLLQHIVLGQNYRVEIFRFNNGSYKSECSGSPCDLNEIQDLVFGSSEDGLPSGYSENVLSLGPLAAIFVEGDAKEPRVGKLQFERF